MRAFIVSAAVAVAVVGIGASAAAQERPPAPGCGSAAHIDTPTETRIERALARKPDVWIVRTSLISSTPTARMLQLVQDRRKVNVLVSYFATAKDAERSLQCHLKMIQSPRYKPVPGLGDEAYVLTKSHLRLRVGALEISIDSADESLATERSVADRVVAAVKP